MTDYLFSFNNDPAEIDMSAVYEGYVNKAREVFKDNEVISFKRDDIIKIIQSENVTLILKVHAMLFVEVAEEIKKNDK